VIIDRKTNFFYGYIVVIASFLIVLPMHGMRTAYGVFFNPLQAEFGWDRTLISGAHSLGYLFLGLFAIVAGRLTDRFGPSVTMTASGFILGLGYFLMSQVTAAWQLYLFYGVIVGIGTSSGDVSLLSTVTRWFVARRGMMSAIVKVGTGMGKLIMPLIAGWLILNYGWRNSYIVLGIACAVSIVLLAQLLKRDPEQKGLEPYGSRKVGSSSPDSGYRGLSFQEAIRTRQFWMVCVIYSVFVYCALAITVHIVPYGMDLGASVAQAAGVLSTSGGVSILGRLVMGATGDRVGSRRAQVICLLVLITALSWLQLAKEIWALYLFAAIYGFGNGGFFTLISPLVAELFGTKSHGVIFGTVLFTSSIGVAIGPIVTGRIFDVTNSYQVAFLILLAGAAIAFTLSTLLRPITVKEEKVSSSGKED